MIRGWQIVYWMVMAISGTWFLLALVASGYFLLGGTDVWRIHQRPITQLIVGAAFIFQPIIIVLAISRAYKLRHQGGDLVIIGRAALPLLSIILIFATIAANLYNENRLRKIVARQRSTGTITFDCSQTSKSVDFDRKKMGPVELRLTSTKRDGQRRLWRVQWWGQSSIPAETFEASTGSIGGSRGLSWTDHSGNRMSALLSFSDIIGSYGPQTIWVTVVKADAATIQQKWNAGDHMDFTCGPDPSSYHD